MPISLLSRRLLAALACLAWLAFVTSSAAVAEDRITLCHAGVITLSALRPAHQEFCVRRAVTSARKSTR